MKYLMQIEIDLNAYLLENGPRFCTHYSQESDSVFRFRPTRTSLCYSMLYVILGVGLLLIATLAYEETHQSDLSLFITGFGVAFIGLGLYVTKDYTARIVFDKALGTFSKQQYRPVLLENIIGLQINRKQQLSYACYELNMLTKSGRRINILNHNGIEQMRKDMRQLALFLDIPPEEARDFTTAHLRNNDSL